uniref:Latent transforming growth factor beta binding protein 1 n=1 Tax=Xiphophorus couchianus TaxID=32473 RepID=A0A3B5MH43_9TELE
CELLSSVCGEAECVNVDGSFLCVCPNGLDYNVMIAKPCSVLFADADECKLFDKEVCKGGYCGNTEGSYECYCTSGHYYDPVQLKCTDVNECLDKSVCDGGECLNTDGSFNCFCRPPMVLSPKSHRCVVLPQLAEMEQLDYQICWQTVTETETCTRPLGPNRKMTFTECCCRFGEAWGMDCALCPPRHSSTHNFRPGLTSGSTEECGILNGCENGRCVRVQEGYTCDCFAGFTLDLSRMACVDVNECSELNSRMSLCRNGKCINTVGSYRCECLPGYRVSDKPNYCVKTDKQQTSTHTQREEAETSRATKTTRTSS